MDQAVRIHLEALKATPSQVPVNKNGSGVYIAVAFWDYPVTANTSFSLDLRARKVCGEEKVGIKQVNRFWHQSG